MLKLNQSSYLSSMVTLTGSGERERKHVFDNRMLISTHSLSVVIIRSVTPEVSLALAFCSLSRKHHFGNTLSEGCGLASYSGDVQHKGQCQPASSTVLINSVLVCSLASR